MNTEQGPPDHRDAAVAELRTKFSALVRVIREECRLDIRETELYEMRPPTARTNPSERSALDEDLRAIVKAMLVKALAANVDGGGNRRHLGLKKTARAVGRSPSRVKRAFELVQVAGGAAAGSRGTYVQAPSGTLPSDDGRERIQLARAGVPKPSRRTPT